MELVKRPAFLGGLFTSTLEMLKGNTPLEDLANLRDQWVEPLEEFIRRLKNENEED